MPDVRVVVLVSAMVATGCGGLDAPDPVLVESGVSRSLADLRKQTLSDVHYAYRLSIPAQRAEPIEGQAELQFRWSGAAGEPLVVDFIDPAKQVRAVRLDGAEVMPEFVEDHIRVPGASLQPGRTHTLEIDFVAGDGALNRNDDFLYTLFVPDRAHFALPLFDQPNLKARFALEMDIPVGWEAVSNGSELSRHEAEGRTELGFAETAPISSYLFAFAAGRFSVETQVRSGRTLRMFHRETDADKVRRNVDAVFELHERALAWLEDYTGVDYPFEKYDFVLIPAFQYGGMEHPGAVFYRADGLLLDEAPTQSQTLGRASLISHETAHMWFGDLVTMNWFDDVWLKEVFANFMAAKIVEPSFPEVDHALRFALAYHPAAYAIDRTAGANPILQPLENLNQAGTLYGPIIYQKAPIVMKHLERRMGEERFRRGLSTYLDQFQFDNASWGDLIGILDGMTDDDLAGWSRVWVEEPGRPLIQVERTEGAVVFNQSDPSGQGRLWPQTLDVWLGDATATSSTEVPLNGPQARLAVTGPTPLVLPMASGIPYGLFQLDALSNEALMEHIFEFQQPVHRGTAWLTLWDAALEGWVPRDRILDLLIQGVANDPNELIFARLAGNLQEAFWRFLPAEQRPLWAGRIEGALLHRLESGDAATLRSNALRAFISVATTPEGVDVLRDLWAGDRTIPGVPISESDRTRIALELAVRQVDGWEALLDEEGKRISNPDRQQRFAFVREALASDGEARDAFFTSLRDPSRREHEPWVLDALGYLNHPLRQQNAIGYLVPSLALLEEVQRTGDIFFPGGWVGAVLGGHNSPEAAEAVRHFLEERPEYPPRLRSKILQSLDPLERAVRLAAAPTRIPVAGGGA